MVINEEADNLSQGEKQLITIARTFLSNPKILILDEATSNVDTRVEVLLQKAIKELLKNKTAFIIAHRLSTIVNADQILVLNRGVIVEQGTHQELLANKNFYYRLYQSQFQK
ncbi:Putative ABC transporter subunit, partial sequence [Candidatus Phytoplasma solani]